MEVATFDTSSVDAARVRVALELLGGVSSDARLTQMANLVVNNGGVWSVPVRPSAYKPHLFEARLFGISAFGESPDDLPLNWIRAAEAVLSHIGQDHAA